MISRSLATQVQSFSVQAVPVVELREYALKCKHVEAYLRHAADTVVTHKSPMPLRLFSLPDTGGDLNIATHFYGFAGGQAERETLHQTITEGALWADSMNQARCKTQSQRSTLFVEAPLVNAFGLSGMQQMECPSASQAGGSNESTTAIYELRRYQLKLGYDTVPRFLELYGAGLPSKLDAPGTDPTTSLLTLMNTEVRACCHFVFYQHLLTPVTIQVGSLNEVIELWRHGNGCNAMDVSRQAAREASEWRKSIGQIAELAVSFTSTIHKPTEFSPWQ